MDSIYLDYNATTPVDREVAEAMLPYFYEHFGNPSSNHPYGITAKKAVELARNQVAALLGCESDTIIFTSGGTESNNAAIRGAVLAGNKRGNHIITSAIEHPAIIEVCRWLENQGFRLTVLPVSADGLVNPADLEKSITAETLLVTVMHANNEVGTIQPIAELASIAHRYGALIHTDAAQSIAKIQVNVKELDVDLLSIAGHKLYAPKGIGALYVRKGVRLEKLLYGANHEAGRRPGTENVLGIVGLGQACWIAHRYPEGYVDRMKTLRDRLHKNLSRKLGNEAIRLNGHPEQRLPNTLSLGFRGIQANALLAEISPQVAASAGSACHSGGISVSPVLKAMNVPLEWAIGTVRFSVGRQTTLQEIDRAVDIIADAVKQLQIG
jgi:cysteine desulfurase